MSIIDNQTSLVTSSLRGVGLGLSDKASDKEVAVHPQTRGETYSCKINVYNLKSSISTYILLLKKRFTS